MDCVICHFRKCQDEIYIESVLRTSLLSTQCNIHRYKDIEICSAEAQIFLMKLQVALPAVMPNIPRSPAANLQPGSCCQVATRMFCPNVCNCLALKWISNEKRRTNFHNTFKVSKFKLFRNYKPVGWRKIEFNSFFVKILSNYLVIISNRFFTDNLYFLFCVSQINRKGISLLSEQWTALEWCILLLLIAIYKMHPTLGNPGSLWDKM